MCLTSFIADIAPALSKYQRCQRVHPPNIHYTVLCQQLFNTSMCRWKLFVLLLQLTSYVCSKEKGQLIEKTIGSKPDITPICINATDHLIIFIMCRIHTERSGKDCLLRYRHGAESVQECDPRFKLMTKNQTVFLHLSSLTPVDSGNHSCECSYHGGTDLLRLNITVEEDEENSSSTGTPSYYPVIIGVFIFIMITGVILGFICRKHHQRRRSHPLSSPANTEPELIEPYSTYIHRENSLYSMVTM